MLLFMIFQYGRQRGHYRCSFEYNKPAAEDTEITQSLTVYRCVARSPGVQFSDGGSRYSVTKLVGERSHQYS